MTLYGATSPPAAGIMNPNFGAANGAHSAPTVALTQLPAGMPLMVAASLGLVPANALVNTVNGISVGGNVSVNGYDPCSVMELMSSGNGNQANGGIGPGAIVTPQGVETQQYTVGLTAVAMQENGPTTVNTDTLGLAPVSVGTPANAIGLNAGAFSG